MSQVLSVLSYLLLAGALFFFISGALGLLRFPDVFCRLHAVTKADTAGTGLLVAGLACRAEEWNTVALLLLVWFVIMASGAINCQLLAEFAEQENASGRD